MRILMRLYVSLMSSRDIKRIGKKAMKLYPDIKWILQEPDLGIEETYGQGYMITGELNEHRVTFFVLAEDPRTENWIHMIANMLEEKTKDGK